MNGETKLGTKVSGWEYHAACCFLSQLARALGKLSYNSPIERYVLHQFKEEDWDPFYLQKPKKGQG